MPSKLFQDLAASQLELLATAVEGNIKSIALYLPKENMISGALEFAPAVCYPPTSRVFISNANGETTLPIMLSALPGFSHARTLIPNYPMLSTTVSSEIGAVEEIQYDIQTGGPALSVPLLNGAVTTGVLLVSPATESAWEDNDRQLVARTAKSLSLALRMDQERTELESQQMSATRALADSLHQVKNPLQALRTFSKLLQRRLADEDNESIMELAEHILQQSERVIERLGPVDGVLHRLEGSNCTFGPLLLEGAPGALARIEHTEEEAEEEEPYSMIFLSDLLEPVAAAFTALGKAYQTDFIVNVEETPGIICQPSAVEEAITNILDNAFRYVQLCQSPTVALTVLLDGSKIRILIQDNGPGIPEEEREKVFHRGYRGQETRSVDGTGLGLDIARTLIEKQGGTVSVLDGNIGCTMEIQLPRKRKQ